MIIFYYHSSNKYRAGVSIQTKKAGRSLLNKKYNNQIFTDNALKNNLR